MNTSFSDSRFERQDIGYLLTAYADGQLAPEGVMWVEDQLDTNADLRGKLKEIRQLQAGLRAAFAGGAPEFVLDLPRRNALLASAANPPRKKIRFQPLLWSGLAASILAVVMVTAGANARYSATPQALAMREPKALAMRESGEYSERSDASPGFAQPSSGFAQPSNKPAGANYFAEEKAVDALADVAAPAAEPVPVQSLNLTLAKNDEEVAALRGQNRALGDELEARRRGLAEANGLTGKAEPELLAKGKREDAGRDGADARKSFSGAVGGFVPAAPPAMPMPAEAPVAKADTKLRTVERAYHVPAAPAKPAAAAAPAPAPATTPPPAPPVVVAAKESQQLARAEGRTAGAPGAAQQGGRELQDEKGADKAAEQKVIVADRQAATTSTASFAGVGGGAGPVAGEKAKDSDGLERNSNNEKTHMAQVAKDSAFQLNVQLAEVEDDYNDTTVALAQREEQKKQAEKAGQDPRLQAAAKRDAYPKIYAEIEGAKAPNVSRGVVASSRNNPQGHQDLVMLTLDQNQVVQEGTEFFIYRGQDYIVSARVEKVLNGMAAARILPDSWNTKGLQIQQGDQAANHFGDGIPAPKAAPQAWLRSSQAFDAQQSIAALRAPVTMDGVMSVAQMLRLIGGDKVGFDAGSVPAAVLAQPVSASLRDEPAARGILRAVRSAGLQAQFTGGLVKLDTATRPLDPSDAQGYDLPTFKNLFGTAPMQAIAVDPVQTVAIDADTASYDYAKARVASGQPVDPATIKPEHFINAMPMDYPAAQGPEAFSLYAEAAPSPFARANTAWGARTAVVSIGAVAKPAAADERKPLALTLAIDCSGSMAQPGGLDRIRSGLAAFVQHLRAEDRVAIVAFGDQARVVLPATPGNDRAALDNALANLATGGATNAAEGLGLAYQLAAETAAPGVESRVLLATDGGTVAGADDLLRRVTAFKDRGVTLVVVGTGATYRAGPLQELATKGDGQHFYVGSDADAQALFTGKLLPDRLAVLAKDAKLQVTWNPQRISHARLIGYDQRRLAAKDFRNNAVDAGELSQDTQVTALFEVLLVDGGTGPLGTAAVRYHDMRRDQVRELACPLPGTILASQASDRLRLLSCAAATAEWLQCGWWSNVHLITPQEIAAQLARCPQPIAQELRALLK